MRALRRAQRRHELRVRVPVGQVEADGGGLVEDEVAFHEYRDLPVRIQLQVLGRSVGRVGAVDEHELERRTDLLKQHVGRQAGIAGVVVELDHLDAGTP